MSYTSVLVSVYILYTEGVMRYTDVVWKQQVHIYDVYYMKKEE